ncbi:TIR-like protein FxsC [Actinoplanes sp. NPDC026619]|uniref:TIR-like protein FxsC n=1 Tax=Actinoplanes sp. NPDC026619 TaxID=3155798 RepID=UPI0033D8D315
MIDSSRSIVLGRRHVGSSVTQPHFFISYVHDSGEDDRHVHRFYADLNHDVLMFAGRRQGESAGFCDSSIKLGQLWSPTLIESLSTAQVLIPLMNPAYFTSAACGKEWAIFVSRLARSGRLDSPDSSIIPLLWVPMELPTIALPYQFKEAAFGVAYERVGLRALIREERRRDDYHAFVERLAQRVVTLSRTAPVVEAPDRPGFDDVISAFTALPGPRLNGSTGPGDAPARNRPPMSTRIDRPILNTNLPEDPR